MSSPIFFESSPPSGSMPQLVSSPQSVSNPKVLDRLQKEKVPIEQTLKDRNRYPSKLDSNVSVFNPPKPRLPLLNRSQQGVNALQKERIERANNEAMLSHPTQQGVGDVLESHQRIIEKKLRDMMGDGLSLQTEFRNGITAIKTIFEEREKELLDQLAAKNSILQDRQSSNTWLRTERADFQTKWNNASERVKHLESEAEVKSGIIQDLQEEIGHLNDEAVASRLQLRALRVELATSRALGKELERKNHDLKTNHISEFNADNERPRRNNAATNKNLEGGAKSNKAIMYQFKNIDSKNPKVPELPNDVQYLGARKRKWELGQSDMPSQRIRSENKETVRNDDGFNEAFRDNK